MQIPASVLVAAGVISCIGVFARPNVAEAATYFQASFSGAINPGSANVRAPFSTNGFTQGQPFSGSFVFDIDSIPGSLSPTNVFFSNFPDIGIIPSATAFNLNLGSLSFQLSDNVSALTNPAIQYRNGGDFNGFNFVANFEFLGSDYQFRINGPVITVRLLDALSGFPTGLNLINARIDIGNINLTDVVSYTPGVAAVPLPAALPLFASILAGGGVIAWRRKRKAVKLVA